MAFSKVRQIDIGSVGVEITNYDAEINLTAANFGSSDEDDSFALLNAAGTDIAFYPTNNQGGTALSHWIETRREYDVDDETLTIHVRIPTLPASGGTSVYMFFADSGASDTSDGDATFPLGFFEGVASLEATTLENMTSVGLGSGSSPIVPVGGFGATREPSNCFYDPDDIAARRYKQWFGDDSNNLYLAYAATPSADPDDWTIWNSGEVVLAGIEDVYVIRLAANSYRMYGEDKSDADQDTIVYSTATSAVGPWSTPQPITLRDSGGTIKSPMYAQSPLPWVEGATTYLAYENYPQTPQVIRLASSTDGIDFQDVQSGAIIDGTTVNWENGDATNATLVPDDLKYTNGRYRMTIHAAGNNRGSGLVTSTDRVNWTDAGEIHCDDVTRLLPQSLMFVPDGDNAYNVEPVGVIMNGQTALDPDVFNPGLLLKEITRDTQTLSGWTAGTGGSGTSSVGFRNGFLRLETAPDVNAAAWILQDDANLVADFEIVCRKLCRSPKFHALAFGAGVVGPANGTSNWNAPQPASGYRHTTATGTGFGNANSFIVEADASNNQTNLTVGGGGAFSQTRFWQVHKLSYLSDGSLSGSFDGTERASASDTTYVATNKNAAIIQGEQASGTSNNGGSQYVDWCYVRPYTGSYGTITVGNQDDAVIPVRGPYSVAAVQAYFPGAAHTQLHTPGPSAKIHEENEPIQIHTPGQRYGQVK